MLLAYAFIRAFTAYFWLNSSICLLARILWFLSASCFRRQSSVSPKFVPTLASGQPVVACVGKCIKDKIPPQKPKHSTKQLLPTQDKCEQTNVRKENDPQLEDQIKFISSIKNLMSTLQERAPMSKENAHKFMFRNHKKRTILGGDSIIINPQTRKHV